MLKIIIIAAVQVRFTIMRIIIAVIRMECIIQVIKKLLIPILIIPILFLIKIIIITILIIIIVEHWLILAKGNSNILAIAIILVSRTKTIPQQQS